LALLAETRVEAAAQSGSQQVKASTVTKIAAPGAKEDHGARCIYW